MAEKTVSKIIRLAPQPTPGCMAPMVYRECRRSIGLSPVKLHMTFLAAGDTTKATMHNRVSAPGRWLKFWHDPFTLTVGTTEL